MTHEPICWTSEANPNTKLRLRVLLPLLLQLKEIPDIPLSTPRGSHRRFATMQEQISPVLRWDAQLLRKEFRGSVISEEGALKAIKRGNEVNTLS